MTFFSVDVETSATTPSMGHLLTVGIVPVVWGDLPNRQRGYVLHGERCYVRIERDELHDSGSEYSSMKWWSEQADDVRGEAYENPKLLRHEPVVAAQIIFEFVRSIESDPLNSFFVANPVAFDKPWLDELFADAGMESPFHYRSLCLRSMRFGMDPSKGFGNSRDTHKPTTPHHALSDALAQAQDLVDMLA